MNARMAFAAIAAAVSLGASAASPKYVFLFIGDGMSTPQRMIAEEFSRKAGNGSLAMNAMPFQASTRTCSATSLVTDSAAAATAIGANGLMIEVHNDPPHAKCDGVQSQTPEMFAATMEKVRKARQVVA